MVGEAIREEGENEIYLPGVDVEDGVTATGDYEDLADCEAVLAVVPAQHLRSVLEGAAPHIAKGAPVVLTSPKTAVAKALDELAVSLLPVPDRSYGGQ